MTDCKECHGTGRVEIRCLSCNPDSICSEEGARKFAKQYWADPIEPDESLYDGEAPYFDGPLDRSEQRHARMSGSEAVDG